MKLRITVELEAGRVIVGDWEEFTEPEILDKVYKLIEKGNELAYLSINVHGKKVYIYQYLLCKSIVSVEVKESNEHN